MVVKAVLPDPSLAGAELHRQDLHRRPREGPEGTARSARSSSTMSRTMRKPMPKSAARRSSYTAGVPPGGSRHADRRRHLGPRTMVNVEELDPRPFLAVLNRIGLPYADQGRRQGRAVHFRGAEAASLPKRKGR